MFWYCHKRGRETRLEREKTVDSNGRIVDLDDDPMLGEADPNRSRTDREENGRSSRRDQTPADGNSNLRPDDGPPSSKRKSSEHRRPVGAEYPGERRSAERR